MSSSKSPLVDGGKLLVLSYFFPPMSVGPAFVMDALMSRFDSRGLIVFSGNPDRYSPHRDAGLGARIETRAFDVPRWWAQEDLGRLRLRALGNVAVAFRVARAAARLLRRPDVKAMLAVYPKQHFLLAACLAARASRKPLLVYFMDTYVEGLPRGRTIARVIERCVARRAVAVFAMSDAHRRGLEQRWEHYGVRGRPIVELPHPYVEEVSPVAPSPLAGRPSILFTGAIYDAQADAIRRLIAALGKLDGLDPHLHLLTQSDPRSLEELGIRASDRVHVGAASRSEARAAQRGADILFLPLAFDAKQDVLETASPSKMPEYLAAGAPILVHAPPSAYLTTYAEENAFAEVVHSPDADALAGAVERLTLDSSLRAQLVERAGLTLERHRASLVAARLADTVRRAL